jgi:hypothetical protein
VKKDKEVFVGPDKDPFVVHGVVLSTDDQEIAECVRTLRDARANWNQQHVDVDWCIGRLAVLTGLDVPHE